MDRSDPSTHVDRSEISTCPGQNDKLNRDVHPLRAAEIAHFRTSLMWEDARCADEISCPEQIWSHLARVPSTSLRRLPCLPNLRLSLSYSESPVRSAPGTESLKSNPISQFPEGWRERGRATGLSFYSAVPGVQIQGPLCIVRNAGLLEDILAWLACAKTKQNSSK